MQEVFSENREKHGKSLKILENNGNNEGKMHKRYEEKMGKLRILTSAQRCDIK